MLLGKRIIQFPFNLNDDTADQIVAEMLEEHSQIDLCITKEEAELIGQLISEEVERSRNDGSEELTAYVNVQRAIGEASDVPEPVALCASSPTVDRGGSMENLVKDFIGTFQLDQTNEEEIVRSLSTSTENILDAVMSKGEGMLSGCMIGRSAGYLPIIRESPPGSNAGPQSCQAARKDSRNADAKCYSMIGEFPHSEAVDIHSSLSSRKRHAHASPHFLKTSFSSPPCLSHFASHSDKSSISRWHRGKSETPEPPDDYSPKYDRILSGRMSGYQFSDGSGLKASFRSGVPHAEDLDDFHLRAQDDLDSSAGKISPRSDGAYTSSVALLLLQQRKCLPEEQEPEVTTPRFPEMASRSSDGRMTAISMFTLKPQVSNGFNPLGHLSKKTDGILDYPPTEASQESNTQEPGDDSLFTCGLPSCSSEEEAKSHVSDGTHEEMDHHGFVLNSSEASARQRSNDGSPPKHQSMIGPNEGASYLSGVEMGCSEYRLADVRVPLSQDLPAGCENSDLHGSGESSNSSTTLPLGLLERPATPPLIGVGRLHLLENTQPSIPWKGGPTNSMVESRLLNLPSQSSPESSIKDTSISNLVDQTVEGPSHIPNLWRHSVANHESSSVQRDHRDSDAQGVRVESSTICDHVPLIRTRHSSHISFDAWPQDPLVSSRLPSSISSPSLPNGSIQSKPFMRGSDQLLNCQFGEGTLAGSARSNSPFEDSFLGLHNPLQKASQKMLDKEKRQRQAEQKRKEMEAKQLENLIVGFGSFRDRSLSRPKPIRPTWNG